MGTRRRFGIRGGKAALYIGAVALAVAASGCATSNGSSTAPPSSTPVTGGTAVMAEPPSTTPNYIWPFAGSAYFTNINTDDLQYLLYRPLYWFGRSGEPTVNYALSLADPPLFDGDKVTITLQHYRWSNGTPVTAQDVMFWLNMELAVFANDGAYT